MIHSKQTESFTDLSLLVGSDAIIFRKLRGAFRDRTGLLGNCATLCWLRQKSLHVRRLFSIVRLTMVLLSGEERAQVQQWL
jgi:hypothetical protein